jgi:pyruvate dehydrogenase E1 component alpha subunit
MEKEIRKQVDDAIAKAKVNVPLHLDMFLVCFTSNLNVLNCICSCQYLQESSMPDTSELFTNVYKKGFGVEVSCSQICFIDIFNQK